jgi:hypothetical protein
MSTASEISICSNALQRLGADPIASFQENSRFAGRCANIWPTVRNMVLRAHPWNCATKRVILAPLVEIPAFDYGYQFNLPMDWLKTVQVGRRNCPLTYQQEGRRILACVNALPWSTSGRTAIRALGTIPWSRRQRSSWLAPWPIR